MKQQVKQVPYGVADFATVMTQDLYYVDKTMYLPLLEELPRNLFFTRPRRFGKSIFLSMLYSYYDCKQKDLFQTLFGTLWVGSHPTTLQGAYQVLYLDFSQITGKIDVLEERFNAYLSIKLDGFIQKYSDYYTKDEVAKVLSKAEFADKIQIIFDAANAHAHKLYLIIDEYDNFTNVVLNEHGERVYHAITHADGFYRDVFKKFKGNFERIFMMGVSPVTLDDVTSGYNVGWNVFVSQMSKAKLALALPWRENALYAIKNISIKPEFDEMLGFSTKDVEEMFQYYKDNGKLSADCDIQAMIDDMKPWYDNYCFAKDALRKENRMFNCDMVLYYLRNYMDNGHAPEQMIDPNMKTDYGKMKKLFHAV